MEHNKSFWSKINKMDKVGQSGTQWSKCNKMQQNATKWINLNKIEQNGTKWIKNLNEQNW